MARTTATRFGANDIGIEIEAGLAFGTGHHGTTRGCLLHFDRLLKRRRPRSVLDVGCGAGVLAIAAAKVLQAQGLARRHRSGRGRSRQRQRAPQRRRRATPRRSFARRREPALREGAPYDVVFANILAKPLRLLAPSLAAVIGARTARRSSPGCSSRCRRRAAGVARARILSARADRPGGLGEPAADAVMRRFSLRRHGRA